MRSDAGPPSPALMGYLQPMPDQGADPDQPSAAFVAANVGLAVLRRVMATVGR